jgi:hypothetical protein
MATTDKLITELEDRERAGHGQWTDEQCRRLKVLSDKLNPTSLQDIERNIDRGGLTRG